MMTDDIAINRSVEQTSQQATHARALISRGTVVKPWGKVAAVGTVDGERVYWFVDKHRCVSMIPADLL